MILAEIGDERVSQHEKWGEQNWPQGTDRFTEFPDGPMSPIEVANFYRDITERNFRNGTLTFKDIQLEEVFEAEAETDTERLRKELIQSCAVAVARIETIDRGGH